MGLFLVVASACLTPSLAEANDAEKEKTPFFHVDTNQTTRRSGNWWDVDLQLGLGHQFSPEPALAGLLGLRAGITRVAEPWFFTAGLTVQWPTPDTLAFGLQLEFSHLWSGIWLQPGVAIQTDRKVLLSATAGFSLIGVETRVSDLGAETPQIAVLARLRIPVGLLALSIQKQKAARKKKAAASEATTP